ncbi:MAG TPA: tRNA dihydrouridine(20/20a) synthase DusA [Kiloniellales bacterium]|nr:tRNA dihydrouridine(20/20a) synthase DusA [Kiloniellales bacterium]
MTLNRFAVAPMMDWTDRHCRRFHRLLTRHAELWTEMVPLGALLHGDRSRFLDFDAIERPLVLQVGGSDPGGLAEAARLAEAWGYDAINLNCGCPSDRVQQGRFGACLMAEPALVARCWEAMARATALPVSVKCRLGIDEQDERHSLAAFVATLAEAGCGSFVVHARKAWLKGLSPKENREVPPLRAELVHALKSDRPELHIVLNGGLGDLDQAEEALGWADGVMLGRAAYQTPWLLSEVDRRFYGATAAPSRADVLQRLLALAEAHCADGWPLRFLARHTLGLMQGVPGARRWRQVLSQGMHAPGAGPELFREAAEHLDLDRQALLAA